MIVRIWGVALAVLAAAAAPAQDFWKHWGDGRAELNGYRLSQPRYGAVRSGTAVLIYVTEDFSDSLRVKAERGSRPDEDLFPVLKLNEVRDFQTGIYDYNVMTSSFARVERGWPLAKVSFSSQEWCGHVYQQLVPRGGAVHSVRHSYFEGEADSARSLAVPEGAVYGDALPILVRGWQGELLAPGESRTVPYLRRLIEVRLEHRELAWESARISRGASTRAIEVPAGSFEVTTYTVAVEGGPTVRYDVEAALPHRLIRWSTDGGEEAVLLGSTRLAYWKLNGPGGEAHLEELGLAVP